MRHTITFGKQSDAKELLAIYSPYVEETTISFEYVSPSLVEFEHRISTITNTYPYLVYRIGEEIVGYAYASSFKTRAAFMWDVETSVYIKPEYHQSGVARKLYTILISLLKKQGFYHVYAYICIPNNKSVRFHEKFGFAHGATYKNTGYKLGQWCDLLCMEKHLQEITPTTTPTPPISIHELERSFITDTICQVLHSQREDFL